MKNMIKMMNAVGLMILAVICVMTVNPGKAIAANEGNCYVSNPSGMDYPGTLRSHLIKFNDDAYGYKQYCKTGILFDKSITSVQLAVPIGLSGTNESGGMFTLGADEGSRVALTVNSQTTS